MVSFSHAQIEQFKREAKQIHRASTTPHSQALDRIAIEHGYSNWSLLMKHRDVRDSPKTKSSQTPLRFNRSPELMRKALLKVPEPVGGGKPTRFEFAQQQVNNFSKDFVSPQNAVEFSIDYMDCLLTVPRFKLHSDAPAYWEMRSWLPYFCQPLEDGIYIIVNRNYKPVGQVSKDWAKYEEFPYLHARFEDALRKRFTVKGSQDGYLFNDGCPPWHSRQDATAYLTRLRLLSTELSGS